MSATRPGWVVTIGRQINYSSFPEVTRMDWAKTVRSLRTRLRLNQGDLARLAGVSQTYVSRLEAGSATPTPEVAAAILALCENPRTRSVFDDFLSSIRHSPFHCLLLDREDERLRVMAASPSMRRDFVGDGAMADLADCGLTGLADQALAVYTAGLEDGHLAGGLGLWASGDDRYWRVHLTPIRDEAGQWFLHLTLSGLNASAYAAERADMPRIPAIQMIEPESV